MIDVLPMADEFVVGQIGRWRALNGFRSVAQCASELRARYAERGLGRGTDPLAHVIAHLSGVDIHEYVRLHTMLPFAAFAVGEAGIVDRGWSAAAARRRGTVTPRTAAYFCAACAAEDRDFWGYSYWRRAHQLPGILWCQKHPDERLHAVLATAAFDQQPHAWLDRAQTVVHCFPVATRDHAVVRRFSDICQAMLDHGRPRMVREVRRALIARASEAGMHINEPGRHAKRPSGVALEHLPSNFLDEVFPKLAENGPGEYFRAIDGAVRAGNWRPNSPGTALVTALLFSSVSEAFDAFAKAEEAPRPTRATPPEGPFVSVYFSKDGNIPAIARALKISVAAAWGLVRSRKSQILYIRRPLPAHNALQDFLDGTPIAEACRKHGASHEIIENLVRLRLMSRSRPTLRSTPSALAGREKLGQASR